MTRLGRPRAPEPGAPTATGRLQITLLGGWAGRLPSGAPLMLPSRKAQALLAYLAMHAGEPQPRQKLMTLLWGECEDRLAGQSLRRALYLIRRALGTAAADLLSVSGDRVSLIRTLVEVDAVEFERQSQAHALELAVGLYRGDLLEGLDVESGDFEQWLRGERVRLYELAIEALGKLLAQQTRAGHDEAAVRTALRLTSLDPAAEPAHRALIRLYHRRGRRAAALRQYQLCVAALHRELGSEPDLETTELYLEVLRRGAGSPRDPSIAPDGGDADALGARAPSGSMSVRLVGRHDELGQLAVALEEARAGRGRLVLITGEAGIGKTRLVEELAAPLATMGCLLLLGRCHPSEQVLPFRPLIDAVRQAGVARETRLHESLPIAWRSELPRILPELAPSGAAFSGSVNDPGLLFEALAGLLTGAAARAPLVLVIEDLQWADEMTLRFLSFLGHRLEGKRILVVTTDRHEEIEEVPTLKVLLDELGRESYAARLALVPLSEDHVAELVAELMTRADPLGAATTAAAVWTTSGGNPLVVVETLRELRERRPGLLPEAVKLPQRVRELIQARLDRLDDSMRQVVAVAAVAGQPIEFKVIGRAARMDEASTAEAVERLVRRRILEAIDDSLGFCHDRIRQVAYDTLPVSRRRDLHQAVGEAIEALSGEWTEDVYDQLAHHYGRAQDPRRAITYLVRLSERLARGHALDAAVRALHTALTHADRLPELEQSRARLDLVYRLAHWWFVMGRMPETLALLEEHRPTLERVGDPALIGQYHFWLGQTHGFLGQWGAVEQAARRVIEEAGRCGDEALLGRAHYLLAVEGYWSGHARRGREHCRRAIAHLEHARDVWWAGQSRWVLCIVLFQLGELQEALAEASRLRELGQRIGDARLCAHAGSQSAVSLARLGQFEAALAAGRDALDLLRDSVFVNWARGYLGVVHREYGRPTEAIPLLEASLQAFEASGGFFHHRAYFNTVLAEACLLDGQIDRAAGAGQTALQICDRITYSSVKPSAVRALAQVAWARGDLEAAAAGLERALREYLETETWYQAARTLVLMGELAQARGDGEGAARALADARERFRSMGVPYWVERVEALGDRLGVPLP